MGASSLIDGLYKVAGEPDMNQDVKDHLTTGYLPLNKIISGKYHGGIGMGRITEIYGGESSGKTLIATMAMIETQRKGGFACLLDFEYAFSLSRGVSLGLDADPNRWYYRQPATAEDGFAIAKTIMEYIYGRDSNMPIIVVVDSVASMLTKEELEQGIDGGNMRTRLSLASFMSEKLPQLVQVINQTNTTMIFLNQVRVNPTVMFGDNETTAGGKALRFYASTRVRLAKHGVEKDKDDEKTVIGEKVKVRIMKNKIWEPFKECEFVTHFATGVNLELSHVLALKDMGLMGDTKGWLEFEGKKYREAAFIEHLKEDREAYGRLLSLFED